MAKKILLVRNDKLGDFILSFPAIALIKKNCPDYQLSVLVPAYTRPVAELNPNIDQCLIDPGPDAPFSQQIQLLKAIRQERFEAVVTLFSTFRIGLIVRFCNIRYRLAPATKLAQIFYNHRLLQRRSQSAKPESEYNADLAREFLNEFAHISQPEAVHPPYLTAPGQDCQAWLAELGFKRARPCVMLHPGSGGSANNLSLNQYAKLVDCLYRQRPFNLIISAGPGEEQQAEALLGLIGNDYAKVFVSRQGLPAFAKVLSCVELFIAGSTGTLHLAGALDIPTLGFYPRRRSATALRWQTLNSPENRLAISPQQADADQDMSTVDPESAAQQAINFFKIFNT